MHNSPPEKSGIVQEVTEANIDQDELQLRLQGHVGELPRQFSAFTMLALSFSITNTWIAYAGTFTAAAAGGGAPGMFWALIVASITSTVVIVGLAELASAFPSSGGQYHYAFMVTSEKWRALTAFVTGWLSVFGWVFVAASADIFVAQSAITLASYTFPEYVGQAWQIWLAYILSIVLSTAVVVFMPKLIPKATALLFWASIFGVIATFIALLAAAKQRTNASFVFAEWQNVTGWPDGLAFLIGVGQAMYGFTCVDSATHLAEELPSPSRHVPQVMLLTPLIGVLTVLPYTLAVLFGIQDISSSLISALPILELYGQVVNSTALSVFLASWVVFLYWGACIGLKVTCGRLIWAFARDNGVPFSPTFAKIHPTLTIPLNATILTSVFEVLYGLIYIGSSTAFYSFISTSILALFLSYAAPQAALLFRGKRRNEVLPPRYLNLGNVFGPICNVFSILWAALYLVIFCIPYYSEVTPGSMNYVSVVISATLLFIGGSWFAGKRKTFVGPNIDAERLRELNRIL